MRNLFGAPFWGALVASCLLLPLGAQGETQVIDATGESVAVPSSGPVISIGGSLTEIAYAVGAAERIVAVDTTSLYPPEARSKPNVGYMRQLSAEPILALEPSLILAVEESGPVTVLDQLRSTGVPIVLVNDDPSYQGVLRKIGVVAEALGAAAEGKALVAQLEADFASVGAALGAVAERPRVLFLLSVGQGGAPLAGGRDTAADGIIRLAGGTNAVTEFEGYKPLSPEAAVAAQPDVILVTKRSLGLMGGEAGLLALPEVAVTPAGQAGRLLSFDGLLLLGFGPRTGKAVRSLAQELHPGLTLPTQDTN